MSVRPSKRRRVHATSDTEGVAVDVSATSMMETVHGMMGDGGGEGWKATKEQQKQKQKQKGKSKEDDSLCTTLKPGSRDRDWPSRSHPSFDAVSNVDGSRDRYDDCHGVDGADGVPSSVATATLNTNTATLTKSDPDMAPCSDKKKEEGDDCHQATVAAADAEASSYEESLSLRYHAREVGVEQFLDEVTVQRQFSSHALSRVFGVVPLPTVEPYEANRFQDATFLTKLKKAVSADIKHRIKLSEYNSVGDAFSLVRKAKNIIVITGAGISTSLGIPDFRSEGGLYSKLGKMGFADPENVFSRDAFEQDPETFFSVASMILPPTDGKFTPGHAFLRLLQDKGKLLTLYTQNIDSVDLAAGVRREKLVQLHGSFETATCISCGYQVKGERVIPKIRKGQIPECARCAEARQLHVDQMLSIRAKTGRPVRRKIHKGGPEPETPHKGILRPDIVFMDEPPRPYLKRFERDCTRADLVIVMGTSLPVEPVRTMPDRVPHHVPQIYIGRNQISSKKNKKIDFDIQLLGECDLVADFLAKACAGDLQQKVPHDDTTIKVESVPGMRHLHHISREDSPMKREGLKDVDGS